MLRFGLRSRLWTRVRSSAPLVVQLAQALASFVIQIAVARQLGLDGLAVFALLFGLIVLGAGVVTGLVGDSLTVMDRSRPGIRSSLQRWAAGSTVSLAVAGAVAAPLLHHSISASTAAWFGLAALLYMVEEVGRRLLMAVMSFWPVVAADLVGLVVAFGVLVRLGASDESSLAGCFAAIAVGQCAALVTIIALLPAEERWLAPFSGHRGSDVWAYGRWRAVQQLFRPATLTSVRLVSIASVGAAAFGRLEAARIVIAPAIHIVAGISNHLFAGFALDSDASDDELVAATDRRVAPMVALVAAVSALALLGSSILGRVVTGTDSALRTGELLGWSAYAAATAASAPYLALAAARGAQRRLTVVRLFEATGSVTLVALLVGVGAPLSWAPSTMAIVTLGTSAVVRASLLGTTERPETDRLATR